MSNLLSVENLTMKFGGLTAIDDLSFDAKNNQITSIIGPNGAGKTTVFNCLTGFYKPTNGQMFLHKEDNKISLRKYTDFKIAYVAKVARTFQNIRLFPAMSVLENLLVAQHNELMIASGYSLYGLLNLKSYRDKEQLQFEFNYKDGKQDGLQLQWHENGQKRLEVNYKDGKEVEGSAKYWNSKGEPVDSREEAKVE